MKIQPIAGAARGRTGRRVVAGVALCAAVAALGVYYFPSSPAPAPPMARPGAASIPADRTGAATASPEAPGTATALQLPQHTEPAVAQPHGSARGPDLAGTSAHPAVRRMVQDAQLLSQPAAPQTSPAASADTSAVFPFGRGSAVIPAQGATPSAPRLDPMQPNPSLAGMAQQAQRDLSSVVDALKAVEDKPK